MNSFNTKFQSQWKDQKISCQVRKFLGPFHHLISLILGQKNIVKDIGVTKNVKAIVLKGSGASWNQKEVSGDNNSQNTWG